MQHNDSLQYQFKQPSIFNQRISELRELSQKRKQLLEISPTLHRQSRNLSVDNQSYPHLVYPLSAFVARSGGKYQQLQRSKQKRIIIVHDQVHYPVPGNDERSTTRQYSRGLDEQISYSRKLQTQEGGRTRNFSLQCKRRSNNGKCLSDKFGPLGLTIQQDHSPDSYKNKQQKLRSCDSLSGQLSFVPKQFRHLFEQDKTKNVLQNILVGMQTKLSDLQSERHMKVFGLQIKALRLQDDIKRYGLDDQGSIVIENQQDCTNLSADFQQIDADQINFNQAYLDLQKNQKPFLKKPSTPTAGTSPQKKQNKNLNSHKNSSRGSINQNFKFNLVDYSQLSREQLFQLKLLNYHYMIFAVSLQHNFYTIPIQTEDFSELKVKVGKGNNSKLLKDCLRTRWWWQIVESSEPEENLNFYWTQLRVPSYNKLQNKSKKLKDSITLSDSSSTLSQEIKRKPQTEKIPSPANKSKNNLTKGKADKFGFYEDPLHKLMTKEETLNLNKLDRSIQSFQKYAAQIQKISINENLNLCKVTIDIYEGAQSL